MKPQLSFQLISALSMLSLLGGGCVSSMMGQPGAALPNEAEVDKMSEQEREAAMKEYLEKEGSLPMNEAEKEKATAMGKEMLAVSAEKSGLLHGVVHTAKGGIKLVQKDGKWMVVFSGDFKTEAGPDLHVYVSGHADPRTSPDVHVEPSKDLGRLVSIEGEQAYELGDLDPKDVKSVIVYCKPFKVVFAAAGLQ